MTTYYQPLFDYMSNQHGLHLLESDMCEIINIVKQMKNKERIAILESEISRLKVANRTTNERLEVLISHLAKRHKGANFSKLNSSGIPNSCDPFKPEAPECVENNGVSGFSQHVSNNLDAILDNAEKRAGIHIHTSNLDNPVKPDFIPDWKDAPEDAVCVAMDRDGQWCWWKESPISYKNGPYGWGWWVQGAKVKLAFDAGRATNAHLLPPDYWKGTLMMRPEAENDYTHLLPNGYEFCDQGEHEKFVKVELFGGVNEEPVGFITDYNIFVGKYLPIRKSSPDYSHLLPEGYEFCSEEDAEKWVKVEILKGYGNQSKVGKVIDGIFDVDDEMHPCYRPIRPIQYKVTTHEITTAVPDPYQPDWSKAPEGTLAHAWDANGKSFWYTIVIDKELTSFMIDIDRSNAPTLPADLDWMQSLRVKPSK
jgi:hypothetical protein